MVDVTAIGEALIDLTQTGLSASGIPEYAANPGGAPANLAVAAAKLGASVSFIGRVGTDAFGTQLNDCLRKNDVDVTRMIADAQHPTTLAIVSVDRDGERSFAFYRQHSADLALCAADVPDDALRNTRFFHFGGVSLTGNPARDTVLNAAARARAFGACVTYDPNYRPALWDSREEAVETLKRPLALVDILKVSDEEMALLTGTDDLAAGSAALEDFGIPLVLVTLGAKGAFYRFRGETGRVDGVPCVVADTNGAGDTFFGAFLSRMRTFSLDTLTLPQLREMLLFANRAASLTTSRAGAIPAMPTLDELR